MAISLKHNFQSAVADEGDTSLVRPSNWNAEHDLTLATSRLVGRTTAGTGSAEEISVGTGLNLSSGSLSVSSTTPQVNSINTFTVAQVIDVNDNSNPALRITQTGTADALRIEDETSPDSTPFVITAAGHAIAGYGSALTIETVVPQFQSHTATLDEGGFGGVDWGNTATGQVNWFGKSRGGSYGTQAIVQNNDTIGDFRFYGSDGVGLIPAARIEVGVDGTPGVNDMPGRILFYTTADGASTVTERMRIASDGTTTITGSGVINTNSTSDSLRITQTGNGNSLNLTGSTQTNAVSPRLINMAQTWNAPTISVTSVSGNGTSVTLTHAAQAVAVPVGSTINVSGFTPTGYNTATGAVTASTTTTTTYTNATSTAVTVLGTFSVNILTPILLNVTNTSSAGTPLLMDFRVGGTTFFSVNRAGNVTSGNVAANGLLQAAAGSNIQWSSRGILTSPAAGGVQLGAADAAAPVAQTFSAQSVVAGTTNTSGQDLTIRGSRGTGTGAGGAIILQTAPAGSAGTVQNAAAERFRVGPDGQLGIAGANYGTSGQALLSGGASAAPSWGNPAASAASGMFWENDLTLTTNYTITTNKNAGTFGPVTINSGVTVTVPSGSTWTIV